MIPGPRLRGLNLGRGFLPIGSPSCCMRERHRAKHGSGPPPPHNRCPMPGCGVVGIVGKIVELSLFGHGLDVRAIPGAKRKKRRRTRLIQNGL